MERLDLLDYPMRESHLFLMLCGGGALAPAFATDPNVGVVKVPDHRLDALAEMVEQGR